MLYPIVDEPHSIASDTHEPSSMTLYLPIVLRLALLVSDSYYPRRYLWFFLRSTLPCKFQSFWSQEKNYFPGTTFSFDNEFQFKQNVPWFNGKASNFEPWYQLLKTMADGTMISTHSLVNAKLLQGVQVIKLALLNQIFQHLKLQSLLFALTLEPRKIIEKLKISFYATTGKAIADDLKQTSTPPQVKRSQSEYDSQMSLLDFTSLSSLFAT